jgi:hypothetical protein
MTAGISNYFDNIKNMKLSKSLHVGSVIAGVAGIISFAAALVGGSDDRVWGVTKIDALLCSAILLLMATWFVLGAMHHMMLERSNEKI